MSSDFVSWVAWLRPSVARAITEDVTDRRDEPIFAWNRLQSVAFYPGLGRVFRPKEIAREVGDTWPDPEWFRVSVAGASILGRVRARGVGGRRHGIFVGSSSYPLLPLIDHLIAIPCGVRFMEGLACARLRPKRRARLAAAWPALIRRHGGKKEIARQFGTYVGHNEDARHGVQTILSAIATGLRQAEANELDLVLIGAIGAR